MVNIRRSRGFAFAIVVLVVVLGAVAGTVALSQAAPNGLGAAPSADESAAGEYIVLSWNDLGMHCYNRDFQDLAVLPPYNTLWAQVVRVGNPPVIVTSGISVTYEFPDNTYSVGKSNFWDYDQQLFGEDLPPNVGLRGKGMAGQMDVHGDHFVAEGIPLTEFRDSNLTAPYPYQLATVIARNATTGVELARSTVVAPVSTEMHCDYCHSDGDQEDIATGRVETNILTLHDMENSENYPPGHDTPLMDRRPVLCAECHSSNALAAPGLPGIPSLSRAVHDKHKEEVSQDLAGCYACHPGPQTQCLRDTMSQAGMDCIDCHGNMEVVSQNSNPWFNEPRCDNAACHGTGYQQDQALYRMSKEHGGIYCAACHDSPHAIAPSRESNDSIKFIEWQGHEGPLHTCTVCHSSLPAGAGPHGVTAPEERSFTFAPDHAGAVAPGVQVVYTHTLRNTGTLTDSYDVNWSSSQNWAAPPEVQVGGGAVEPPVSLGPGQGALVSVEVTVPEGDAVMGLRDRTIVTATSTISSTLSESVIDTTLVYRARVYLPLVLQD
jgi:hypothetical protein